MKTNRLRAALALLAAALAAAPVWADCQLVNMEIPVRIVNQRPIGTLNLNGTEVAMLIDSGAFYSFLTPSVAAQLGLKLKSLPDGARIEGYTGAVDAKVARVERVIFQRTQLSNVEFIVGGNEMGSGIQGILGRNFLSTGDTEYDLAHGVVRLMFPKGDCDKVMLAYWAGDAPVIEAPLERGTHDRDTAIRVTARINDVELQAMLDTGAPRTALRLAASKRAGVYESELVAAGRSGGVGLGTVRSWTGQFASFELGGEQIRNNQLVVNETRASREDMLLGLDYFLSHRIYVSRLQRKLYATWNGVPVFARDGATHQYDASYASRPADIAPGDAAALARRGEASAARGQLAAALSDLDRACELAPQSGAHFFARARVHAAMNQFAKARQDLDEALRLQPGLHEALAIRASLRAAGGERGGALLDLFVLDMALPPSSHLREAMADAYVRLGEAKDALRQWELWVPTHRADAHLPKVLSNRCHLRTRLNIELQQALKDCQEAVNRDDGEPAYRENLGWVHLLMKTPELAVVAFTDAIYRKHTPSAFYGRALANQRLADDAAAGRDLKAARRLRPGIDAELRRAGLPLIETEIELAAAEPEPERAGGFRPSLHRADSSGVEAAAAPGQPASERSCVDSAAPPTLLGPQSRILRGQDLAPCQAAKASGTGQPRELPGR